MKAHLNKTSFVSSKQIEIKFKIKYYLILKNHTFLIWSETNHTQRFSFLFRKVFDQNIQFIEYPGWRLLRRITNDTRASFVLWYEEINKKNTKYM